MKNFRDGVGNSYVTTWDGFWGHPVWEKMVVTHTHSAQQVATRLQLGTNWCMRAKNGGPSSSSSSSFLDVLSGGWGSRDDVVVLLVKGAKIGTTTTQFDIVVLSFWPRDVVSFVRGWSKKILEPSYTAAQLQKDQMVSDGTCGCVCVFQWMDGSLLLRKQAVPKVRNSSFPYVLFGLCKVCTFPSTKIFFATLCKTVEAGKNEIYLT